MIDKVVTSSYWCQISVEFQTGSNMFVISVLIIKL